jgi:hypothetical protein
MARRARRAWTTHATARNNGPSELRFKQRETGSDHSMADYASADLVRSPLIGVKTGLFFDTPRYCGPSHRFA